MEPPYDQIWYVDDEKGIIRYYLRNASGSFMLADEKEPGNPLWTEGEITKFNPIDGTPVDSVCVAWEEERRAIKIILKEEM